MLASLVVKSIGILLNWMVWVIDLAGRKDEKSLLALGQSPISSLLFTSK
jgi:hypothetical protein